MKQDANHALSDRLIRQTADALISEGFAAAGYKVNSSAFAHSRDYSQSPNHQIVWVDDAWMSKERSASGALVPDPQRWPHGLKNVSDYLHERGLLFGLYGDIGTRTCAGYPGLQRQDGDWSRMVETSVGWSGNWLSHGTLGQS